MHQIHTAALTNHTQAYQPASTRTHTLVIITKDIKIGSLTINNIEESVELHSREQSISGINIMYEIQF